MEANLDPVFLPEYRQPTIEHPADNQPTAERWELGMRLFFDPIISSDSTISCASCHKPKLSFSDDKAFSFGVQQRKGNRNSPSLANIGMHPYFTREGGVPSLEMQILVPLQEHVELDLNILQLQERLKKLPHYVQMSQRAYQRDPDYFVITRALACFERSLLSDDSPFDRYLKGDRSALSSNAIAGMTLFFSEKTSCSSCHAGFNFSNYAFENNGLYEAYADSGRMRLTRNEADRALFKVPSLRNVAMTAPYMHDGSIESIEKVIEHYNSGAASHSHKSDLVRPLNLTAEEKGQLIDFLHSLSDSEFSSGDISKFKYHE